MNAHTQTHTHPCTELQRLPQTFGIKTLLHIFLFFGFWVFGSTMCGTQGLLLGWQVLYHLSHIPTSFTFLITTEHPKGLCLLSFIY
jgi:hypothetical protein